MTRFYFKNYFCYLIVLYFSNIATALGQNKQNGFICGHLKLDNTWDSEIYLSYIATFNDMYVMSNDMIISKTEIDSLGYFKFDLSFLPEEENIYRIHLIKRGDIPATLIIGGKDENHMFFIANRYLNIELKSNSNHPPFKNVVFIKSNQNIAFQKISDLVFKTDSIASMSNAVKRQFIENKLQKDLRFIADTSKNALVSLYAIYKSKFESNYTSNIEFYKTYLRKWRFQKSNYFISFRDKIPIKSTNYNFIPAIIFAFTILAVGFYIGKSGVKKNNEIEKLTVQERKIFELLKQGATNQEISNLHNIEISTVKSHVSSILSKLKVKSRKEIMNIKMRDNSAV